MTAFTEDWLGLREPADLAARDPGLMARLGAALAHRDHPVRIVDLGSGTGAQLRALAPHLGPEQEWCLVDHDPTLLAAARFRLSTWAEAADAAEDGLVLRPDGQRIAVRFMPHDLATGLDGLLEPQPDLVTAAALFDLVSPVWIAGIAAAIVAHELPFYAALTVDGQASWEPGHPDDGVVWQAFLTHLFGDKGFGPAAGPRAAGLLQRRFLRHGYRVETAQSPWHLGPDQAGLMLRLAEGVASAAGEADPDLHARARAWRDARVRDGRGARIGHLDILALPPDPA